MADDPVYEVLVEGGKVGPFDRRTIIGMRIKNALTSDHVLVASDGSRLKVADLLGARARDNSFQPTRSGSFSLVQATYPASLLQVSGRSHDIPAFRGEVEARIQTEVLRIAGRHRHGLGWKEDRVKLPLADIAYTRVRGSLVDLWLAGREHAPWLRVTLELFTPEAAAGFVHWLPGATPWAEGDSAPAPLNGGPGGKPWVWLAVAGTALAVGAALLAVLLRRTY